MDTPVQKTFEHLGWFLEYYIEGKFVGTVIIAEADREVTGYYSREDNISPTDIILDNGKKIKKHTNYYTRLYPLCGRVIDKQKNIFKKPKQELNVIYKDIPNFEGLYQAGSNGEIKSVARVVNHKQNGKLIVPEKLLSKTMRSGYWGVNLSKNNVSKPFKVSQLVAMAFHEHEPCGMEIVVDHINGIKTDDRPVNLQLLSNRENVIKSPKKNKTSKYLGVSYCKRENKWRATYMGKSKGYFDTELEAKLEVDKYI